MPSSNIMIMKTIIAFILASLAIAAASTVVIDDKTVSTKAAKLHNVNSVVLATMIRGAKNNANKNDSSPASLSSHSKLYEYMNGKNKILTHPRKLDQEGGLFGNLDFPNGEISQEHQKCFEDTEDLYNTTTLSDAHDAWEADLDNGGGDLTGDTCIESEARFECTLDSTDFTTHNDLVNACTQVGGIIYLYSESVACNIRDSGQSFYFSIGFANLPICFDDECPVQEVADEYLQFGDEFATQYEDLLGFLFESVECSTPSASPTIRVIGGVIASAVAFVWIAWFE